MSLFQLLSQTQELDIRTEYSFVPIQRSARESNAAYIYFKVSIMFTGTVHVSLSMLQFGRFYNSVEGFLRRQAWIFFLVSH